MGELGRPILRTGIAKIENGTRRVDVDDLMALAIALAVTPNRLLLNSPLNHEQLDLVPETTWVDRHAWQWACGENPRQIPGPKAGWQAQADGLPALPPGRSVDWMTENRPHRPPVRLSIKDWQKIDPFEKRFEELRRDMAKAGYDVRALFEDAVFEFDDGGES